MRANEGTTHGIDFFRIAALTALVLLCAAGARSQPPEEFKEPEAAPSPSMPLSRPETPPLDASPSTSYVFADRWRDYLRSNYQPSTWIVVGASSAYRQIENGPPEWRQGLAGYGRRFLSAYGISVASNTVGFGVAALDHEDTRYKVADCPKKAVLRRLGHVMAYTAFPTRDGGGRTFAFSTVAGAYGAGFIATTWYPANRRDPWTATRLGTFTLATGLGMNLLQEFIRPHLVWVRQQ